MERFSILTACISLGFSANSRARNPLRAVSEAACCGNTRMEMGYASAIATILFIIMILANLLVRKILRRVGS